MEDKSTKTPNRLCPVPVFPEEHYMKHVQKSLDYTNAASEWHDSITQRDLRDLAAYMYVPCCFEAQTGGDWEIYADGTDKWLKRPEWTPAPIQPLTPILLHSVCTHEVRNLKLKLRPIDSLTDSELEVLFEMIFRRPWHSATPNGINREDNGFEVFGYTKEDGRLDVSILFDGRIALSGRYRYVADNPLKSDWYCPFGHTGAAIAYLQSIGIYVPGTIREQFVDLQQ